MKMACIKVMHAIFSFRFQVSGLKSETYRFTNFVVTLFLPSLRRRK